MGLFIQGIGSLHLHHPSTQEAESHASLSCPAYVQEPDYKSLLSPMQLRRMSKVIRMGCWTALQAMHDAGVNQPDKILVGSGLGCLADTELFLKDLVLHEEQGMSPTAFIQSTHNTVSGQIALLCSCYGYNFTYVHDGHSFESALLDALMQAEEQDAPVSILLGGLDECTPTSAHMHQRVAQLQTGDPDTDYTTAFAEGSSFFLMQTKPHTQSYAEVLDVYLSHILDWEEQLPLLLQKHDLATEDITHVLCGTDEGDLPSFLRTRQQTSLEFFKQASGEYPTAVAYAMARACVLIRNWQRPENKSAEYPYILVLNRYKSSYFSILLLKGL